MRGKIDMVSVVGVGTTVTLTLPVEFSESKPLENISQKIEISPKMTSRKLTLDIQQTNDGLKSQPKVEASNYVRKLHLLPNPLDDASPRQFHLSQDSQQKPLTGFTTTINSVRPSFSTQDSSSHPHASFTELNINTNQSPYKLSITDQTSQQNCIHTTPSASPMPSARSQRYSTSAQSDQNCKLSQPFVARNLRPSRSQQAASPATGPVTTSPPMSLHILLVDDSITNVKLMKYIVSKWRHTYSVAMNGQEAVEKFQKESFDCILMDLHSLVDFFDIYSKRL